LALIFLGESRALAKANLENSCEGLKSEIKAMEQAQKILLKDLVATNDNMAGTLDRYADDLKSDQSLHRSASVIEIMDVKRSAGAFRQHKTREQKLIAKFELKSDQLLNKVESCLRR
jgi:hypothetical protein